MKISVPQVFILTSQCNSAQAKPMDNDDKDNQLDKDNEVDMDDKVDKDNKVDKNDKVDKDDKVDRDDEDNKKEEEDMNKKEEQDEEIFFCKNSQNDQIYQPAKFGEARPMGTSQ